MTSKQVFLDTPLLKRGGAGKRKGNRSRRRSMSPAGRAWWNTQAARGWWTTKTAAQIKDDINLAVGELQAGRNTAFTVVLRQVDFQRNLYAGFGR